MSQIKIKTNHKVVRDYYRAIASCRNLNRTAEGAVAPAFAALLRHCAGQRGWTLVEQYGLSLGQRRIRVDGALVDGLAQGFWEAKDGGDDLAAEALKKFHAGYPRDNILFQAPERAMLWQGGALVLDEDISRPQALVEALRHFFAYRLPRLERWREAVEDFRERAPDLARGLAELIRKERLERRDFAMTFAAFAGHCRQDISPGLTNPDVESLLVQHMLIERLFRRVFQNPEFVSRNAVAREVEKVVDQLTAGHFGRDQFLRPLDAFYLPLESAGATAPDFACKRRFLGDIYERYFRGYAPRTADTHGIAATPEPVADFVVRGVAELLNTHFGKTLADEGVGVLDPFAGTGRFLVRVMREIPRTAIARKYADEIFANEVMLLPYYAACMNIEREYFEMTRTYKPFPGICLVDTFQLGEVRPAAGFQPDNAERIRRQGAAPIAVILGNPPCNARQEHENDNNRNRRHPVLDGRVTATYARDSRARNKSALSDHYVKAVRWASDRILESGEGIVAFVTNAGYLTHLSFDGMRRHLAQDFDRIYVLDLGGNVRANPRLSGPRHNVFGIRLGMAVSFFVKTGKGRAGERARIFHCALEDGLTREEKLAALEGARSLTDLRWTELIPDEAHNWLTRGRNPDYSRFPAVVRGRGADPEPGPPLFELSSAGVKTNRDAWVTNFRKSELRRNVRAMIEVYNDHARRRKAAPRVPVDAFVDPDPTRISWSRDLKSSLRRAAPAEFDPGKIVSCLYRPFSVRHLYLDKVFNEEVYHVPAMFPPERENMAICVSGPAPSRGFQVLGTRLPPISDLLEKTRCLPFFLYDAYGRRRENVTDQALEAFRKTYADPSIGKIDLFHYAYGLLHHPEYARRYAWNLARDVPRLPFLKAFRETAGIGRSLFRLHADFRDAPPHPLALRENPAAVLDWRVARMRASRDGRSIRYNDFLTVADLPEAAFAYRIGARPALQWVLDQQQVKTDPKSGLVSDPNDPDRPEAVLDLLARVVAVSLETVRLTAGLPEFDLV